MEKFRRGKCCFFRVIFDGFVFILFHELKWYFHPVFACTVFMLFRPIFVLFSDTFKTVLDLGREPKSGEIRYTFTRHDQRSVA